MSVTMPPGASIKALGKISVTVKTITATLSRAAGTYTGKVQITSAGHGLIVGQTPVISGIVGTTEANGKHTVVEVVDANNFVIDVTFANAWVSGGVATIPVDLYGNYTDLRTFGSSGNTTPAVRANSIFIQALASNTANVFVGTIGMNRVTYDGVIAELEGGQSLFEVLGHALNGLRPGELRIDATVDGEGVLASYIPF
jgi:hypothetical protein